LERWIDLQQQDAVYSWNASNQSSLLGMDHVGVFIAGKAAMAVLNAQELHRLIRLTNADEKSGIKRSEWDLAGYPRIAAVGSVPNPSLILPEIFAIHRNAKNREMAEAFIKFVSGDHWARVQASHTKLLLSRYKYNFQADTGASERIAVLFGTSREAKAFTTIGLGVISLIVPAAALFAIYYVCSKRRARHAR